MVVAAQRSGCGLTLSDWRALASGIWKRPAEMRAFFFSEAEWSATNMFFVLRPEVTDSERERLFAELRAKDMTMLSVTGNGNRAFALVGPSSVMEGLALDRHPLVEEVVREKAPYKRDRKSVV